jgi:5-methylcytosine-specific restriction enzyme A
MPSLPIQCAEPRCSRHAGPRGRCPQHGGTWGSTLPMAPGWRSLRAQVLTEEPNCALCGRPAVTVDHRLARAFGGSDERSNLRSLCAEHARDKDDYDRKMGSRRAKQRREARQR